MATRIRPVRQTPSYEPPASALRVLDVLENAGFEAWIVGGWVRDALLGAPNHDVDVTTSARWEEGAAALRAAGITVRETGTPHGTITAVIDGEPIEVTTYRVDGTYSDHRHPDEVRFVSDVREDLARRDFTINAMAYHPTRGLLDPYGGAKDLAAGVVRAVGDPASRFEEDALRTLRAVRFACRMGFSIEEGTQRALEAAAPGLEDVADERIGKEMDGILATGRVGWALVHEADVLCAAIPELAPMRGFDQRSSWHAYDVMVHTAHVCNAVECFTAGVASSELRWAALLHDIGKPASFVLDKQGRGHFYGHPIVGAGMVRTIMRRLAMPTPLIQAVSALVHLHDHIIRPTERSMCRTMALLEESCPGHALSLAHELMDLRRADAVSKVPKCAWYAVELDAMDKILRDLKHRGVALRVSDLAVDGDDVMEIMGAQPGPMIGHILSKLLAAVVDGEVPNTREALIMELAIETFELE